MPQQAVEWKQEHVPEVQRLVERHHQLREPLLLAVYYAPSRNPHDVFLFEVVENFGSNSIDPDEEIFEVTYGPTDSFPMPPDRHLHLLLTNPQELAVAARDRWPLIEELRDAIRAGRGRIIWSDPARPDLWEMLNA